MNLARALAIKGISKLSDTDRKVLIHQAKLITLKLNELRITGKYEVIPLPFKTRRIRHTEHEHWRTVM